MKRIKGLRYCQCYECGTVWAVEADAVKCCHGEYSKTERGISTYVIDLPVTEFLTLPVRGMPEWATPPAE